LIARLEGQKSGRASHQWSIPSGVPPTVFLKVTTYDNANNVGTVSTREKVSIDLVVPEGRINGVRPMIAVPEAGPMPRVIDFQQERLLW
jgi:hypothetical protein